MKRVLIIFGIFSMFLLSSCFMQKVEYVKDMEPDSLYRIKASQALKIQIDDRIAITVYSKNSELAAPFNTELGGYRLVKDKEVVRDINSNENFEEGYLVDSEGDIVFPILGKIKVQGLSTDEISLLIANKIKNGNYLDDPEVKVRILNFKIMTMGAISNQIFNVPEGKINLFQAIVKAGGLTPNSDAAHVKVIREEKGERKLLVVNVEKYDAFNSDAYNLQQNDIVYVAPKYRELTPGTQSVWQMVGMVFGVVSLSLSAASLFIRK